MIESLVNLAALSRTGQAAGGVPKAMGGHDTIVQVPTADPISHFLAAGILMADWIEPGQAAPAFTLKDDSGTKVKLSDLKGNPVLVYFYPRDDTPGCTREACAFRDRYDELKKLGVQLFGVSGDTAESHQKFREKFSLPFPLLVDSDHAMSEKYGAYREKNMYGKKSMGIQRSTYLIDAQGKVAKVWKRVTVDGHDQKVIEAVHQLESE
ncbi:thioredoxin-dependent thiol peroxidase [Rubripirellula lacrimiformis]